MMDIWTILHWLRARATPENKQKFAVIFCDEYDYTTKFHIYQIFDSYEAADHCIRMSWGKSIQERRENGYKVDSAWIMIQPL